MASTRARFTASYVAISMSAIIVFSVALWTARETVANDQVVAQATDIADRLISDVQAAQESGIQLTAVDTTFNAASVRATPAMGNLLEPRPGYFFIIGPNDIVLYQSTLLRQLREVDRARILSVGASLKPDVGAFVPVGDSVTRRIAIVSRRSKSGVVENLDRLIAGIPNEDVELSGQLLVGTIIVMVPFVLLVCIAAAYFMAGRVFKPMHDLTNQLEAISDGKSLHRRLPPDTENDELGRLTTTLNAMLSRLEVSFAGLRRFTADASHELKTPLAVLRVDVERAMHPRTTRDDRLIALEESLQEVTRMSDLVDSLLTLARADEGRFELVNELIHVEPLMRDVYETATILGESNGLSISMPTIDDAVVLGERTRLRQLLLNLITNAIKYTPRGGRVELSSTLRGSHEVAIAVRDTGIGISATDLPHIFDRFWRADRARSRGAERSGFGLGLAISQYIAQAHGGVLVAQSRLGRGTVFTVILPTTPAPIESADPGSIALAGPATAVRRPADSNSDLTVS